MQQKRYTLEAADWVMIILLAVILGLLICSTGCASATPRYDSAGNLAGIDGYGFLRDLEVKQVRADGSSFEIKSKSTSADIMKAGNELLGTVTATASKAMP